MDAATASRFQAGAGLDPATLRAASTALVALALILWAAWTVHGLHGQWRAGDIDTMALLAGTVRAAVVALIVMYFLQ
jgi:integrating conjugative element protein (TIGR03758 family)